MKRPLFLFLIIAALIVPAGILLAQTAQPLVPCEGTLGTKGCTAQKLTVLFMNVINFLVAICSIIAVIMFVWAGIILVTAQGNASKITQAKEMFKNVVIGIVLILGAWTIIDTVMQMLVGQSLLNGGAWYYIGAADNPDIKKFQEQTVSGAPIVPGSAQDINQGANDGSAGMGQQPAGAGSTVNPGPLTADEKAARDLLQQNGINVNTGACATVTPGQLNTGCTNISGVSQQSISNVIALNEQCGGCVQTISGGSEPHGSSNDPHAAGVALDIYNNPTLDSYIQNNFTQSATNQNFYYGTINGQNVSFLREGVGGSTGSTGPHWHMQQGK